HTRFSRDWSSDVCSSDLQPPEILDRIAQVCELPVEHRPYAFGSDDEVPVPEVAMNELGPGRQGRNALREPPQPELERRVGLTEQIGRASCREGVETPEVS